MTVSDDESKKYFNSQVKRLAETNSRHKRIFQGFKMCPIGPSCHVLDLGCGTGITSEYLARAGCQVTAVDYAEELIEYGRENRRNKNIEWHVADISKIDLPRKFNLIVLADVLEHVDPDQMLPLLQVIFDHSYEDSFVYVNIPYWPWQEFVHHYGIGDVKHQTDNIVPLSSVLNMFTGIHYLPMHVDIYGMGTPLEYCEIIFVRREDVWLRWNNHYGDIGVIETDDGSTMNATADNTGDS